MGEREIKNTEWKWMREEIEQKGLHRNGKSKQNLENRWSTTLSQEVHEVRGFQKS